MKRLLSALVLTACGATSTLPPEGDAGPVALDAGDADSGFASTDAGPRPDAGVTRFDAGWQTQLLARHNEARAAAMPTPVPALPEMAWSTTVATTAQGWADRCKFEHNTGSGYGEDLYASTADTTSADVVDDWTNESANYTYATNTCALSKVCGHYTQVVWRTSTALGCGKATCTTNSPLGNGTWFFWVCDYSPPGNYVGQKPY